MSFVERREYVDGVHILIADIRDDGHVTFTIQTKGDVIMFPGGISHAAAVSSTVLRQLADAIDAAERAR